VALLFFADSGSVSVEVALKMAIQYWQGSGRPEKNRFLTVRGGYHGDTFGAMALCDPVTGMHEHFTSLLSRHYFAETPRCRFDDPWDEEYISDFKKIMEKRHGELAAVMIEPGVQGAGGIMVPLNEEAMMIDLMARFGLPVLLVAGSGLGTINHTLLSLEQLRRRGISVAGIVMNGDVNWENREALEFYGKTEVLAEVEPMERLNAKALTDCFYRNFV